jgi:beta-lactamase class A
MLLSRRTTLLGAAALAACAPQTVNAPQPPVTPEARVLEPPGFVEIEARVGGRMGVAALNTGSADEWFFHRADERFVMCSMFKWLVVAQMLHMSESSAAFLTQRMRYNETYLANLGHAPATQSNLARGWMTIEELCRAAVVQSDNGAANLLLEAGMGPEGLTNFLRANGDDVTRVDRNEPGLNENLPGDERDTTTPRAMALTMRRFLLTEDVLNASSRQRLKGWLIECETGLRRLRAGFPTNWRAGDKTGTGFEAQNATTDVAIAWPPGREPIIVACFLTHSTVTPEERNAAHAEVGRIIAEAWG